MLARTSSSPCARAKFHARALRDARTRATFAPGTKVRVKTSVVVFHVPKMKGQGKDLKGLEGVVDSRADAHEGVAVSATFGARVKLPVGDGSEKTFIAHLEDDELEAA